MPGLELGAGKGFGVSIMGGLTYGSGYTGSEKYCGPFAAKSAFWGPFAFSDAGWGNVRSTMVGWNIMGGKGTSVSKDYFIELGAYSKAGSFEEQYEKFKQEMHGMPNAKAVEDFVRNLNTGPFWFVDDPLSLSPAAGMLPFGNMVARFDNALGGAVSATAETAMVNALLRRMSQSRSNSSTVVKRSSSVRIGGGDPRFVPQPLPSAAMSQ